MRLIFGQMLPLEIKYSDHIVQRLCSIERLVGKIDKITDQDNGNSTPIQPSSIATLLLLDSSTDPELANTIKRMRLTSQDLSESCPNKEGAWYQTVELEIHELVANIESFLNNRIDPFPSREAIFSLFSIYSDKNQHHLPSGPVRKHHINVAIPSWLSFVGNSREEVLFPAIQPYLIDSRLTELTKWAEEKFQNTPLVTTAVFHLMFLHISPLPKANHLASLVLMRKLLATTGYPISPESIFLSSAQRYFQALKQAERTLFATWATLNVWITFFLDSLLEELQQLAKEKENRLISLTTVQSRILEVIREAGSASRDRIAQTTGFNESTVKYNLTVMTQRGLLNRRGGGRTTSYRLV